MNVALRRRARRHQPSAAEIRDDVLAALDEVEQAQGVGAHALARDAEAALERLMPLARQAGVLSPASPPRPDFDQGTRGAHVGEPSMGELIREAATGRRSRPIGGRP
jgi:hypothetical protein